VVEWKTSSERGTAGFYLYRLDATGNYIPINHRLLPGLIISPQGGTYSLIDKGATTNGRYTYILAEVEAKGSKRLYGPFTVQVGGESVSGTLNSDISNLQLPVNCKSGRCNGADLYEKYSRKGREMSAEKKARLKAFKEARKAYKALGKNRTGESIKISVSTDGLYYLSAADIAALMGTSADKIKDSIKKKTLAMSNQGQDVAYLPDDKNAGIFFYGEGIDSIYTNDNIYWLRQGKGLTMESLKGQGPKQTGTGTFTETVHAEKDTGWASYLFTDPEADIWLWGDAILGGYPPDDVKTFEIEAKGVADLSGQTSPPSAVLTVHLQGYTDISSGPDHHAVISINGNEIGNGWLDGAEAKSFVFTFDQKYLQEKNTVEVKGLLDSSDPSLFWSLFLVDSFDLTYQRTYDADNNALLFKGEANPVATVNGFDNANILLFDVTNPKKPQLNKATTVAVGTAGKYKVSFVPGSPTATYLAIGQGAVTTSIDAWADSPSSLSSPTNAGDYVVIAPEELAGAAQSLANYRQTLYQTKVVTLENIMDEFNYGIFSPRAIHDFLSYAHRNWSKPPKYVVLGGDGTYDYKNILGYNENLVPIMSVTTPMGLCPSDNFYADINADHVPEMAIGRIPVLTEQEFQDVIAKIKQYESSTTQRIILLADNPDDGGKFDIDTVNINALIPLPPPYQSVPIYLGNDAASTKSKLITEMNAGAFLFNYIGHAGYDILAEEGLLTISDLTSTSLNNWDGLPVLTAMTCYVGMFAYPGYDTLSEALVLKPGKGAVASWSPTGLSYNDLAVILDREFFSSVFARNKKVLGDAIKNALQEYNAQGGNKYIMDIYNLLGDPALRLK
jgi:hypothetical protein